MFFQKDLKLQIHYYEVENSTEKEEVCIKLDWKNNCEKNRINVTSKFLFYPLGSTPLETLLHTQKFSWKDTNIKDNMLMSTANTQQDVT